LSFFFSFSLNTEGTGIRNFSGLLRQATPFSQ